MRKQQRFDRSCWTQYEKLVRLLLKKTEMWLQSTVPRLDAVTECTRATGTSTPERDLLV